MYFCVVKDFDTVDQLEQIKRPIEADLERLNEMMQGILQTDNQLLGTALKHLSSRRGKQMRPVLTLLAAKGVAPAGEISEGVLHAAIAMELLHTASLVHDDIVDESDRRRGLQSINSLLDNKAAVLVGDFLLSKAIEHAVVCGNMRVVELVAEVGTMLADGELLQLACVDSTEIEESAYYDVVRKKTASLFSACAEMGALLAAPDNEGYVYTMKRFGMLLGICFQLRDDIFDFDPTHDVGKPAGNDMKEGKLTLPVIYATQKSPEALELALKVRRMEATEDDIASLVALTTELGGIAYATAAMRDFSQMASGLLFDVPEQSIAESLQHYLDFVTKREF